MGKKRKGRRATWQEKRVITIEKVTISGKIKNIKKWKTRKQRLRK